MNTNQNKAPIALFVYNRPDHTRRTVEALAQNIGAKDAALHIFSDAAKSAADIDTVDAVRKYIHEVTGFRQVIIVEQTENFGLAKSIINGVSSLCEKYGRVIVLEDDLETSPYFLNFMNEALDFYANMPEVLHIAGYRYPAKPFEQEDTFFLHIPFCWGWATWQRAWVHFEKDISIMKRFDRAMIKRFDFDNTYTNWIQLKRNRNGKMNTWFVFWYAILFLRGGLSLFPARSLVNNFGLDGSGTHSPNTSDYHVQLSNTPVKVSSIPLCESAIGFEKHKMFFKSIKESFLKRAIRKIRRILAFNF